MGHSLLMDWLTPEQRSRNMSAWPADPRLHHHPLSRAQFPPARPRRTDNLKPTLCPTGPELSQLAPSRRTGLLQDRSKLDLARQWRYPFLSAVPRKRRLNDLNHAEARQDLDVAAHCAPVALQFLRQRADRCWRLFDLLEQKHSLFC